MKKFKQVAFLCGYFDISVPSVQPNSLPDGWKELICGKEVIEEYKKFFYYEFVDFCLDGKSSRGVHSYRYDIDKTVSLICEETTHHIFCKNITVYVMPYRMLIYSLEIEQDVDDLNQVTEVTSLLRSVMGYDKPLYKPFIETVIQPLIDLYKLLHGVKDSVIHYSQLVENGNKLKVFQIVNAACSEELEKINKDVLLFELGTLLKIGSYERHEANGVSSAYLNEILQKNKISFYNNWTALTLLDTFTIFSIKAPDWLLSNWTDTYFRLIYIHSLFLKFYLFRLNVRFRKNPDSISQLEDELILFESRYCFHKISYNFLPLEIYKAVDKGLEISEERMQLYHLIDVENQRREKKNDKKVNHFLVFLTLLTMLSTLWDSSCLFNELYPYNEYVGSTIVGYKIVVSFLSLVIVVAIIIIFNKKK